MSLPRKLLLAVALLSNPPERRDDKKVRFEPRLKKLSSDLELLLLLLLCCYAAVLLLLLRQNSRFFSWWLSSQHEWSSWSWHFHPPKTAPHRRAEQGHPGGDGRSKSVLWPWITTTSTFSTSTTRCSMNWNHHLSTSGPAWNSAASCVSTIAQTVSSTPRRN